VRQSYLTLKGRPSDYCGKSCSYIGRKYSKEARRNMSKAKKGSKSASWKGGVVKKGLPLYDTYAHRLWCDDVDYKYVGGLKILKVKCANCDTMFVKLSTVIHRVRYLEGKETCESRFYCSDKCRAVCPIFWQHKYPKGYKSFFEYTDEEYSVWRNEVMIRANYKCEYCGNRATDAHHINQKY